MTKAGSAFSTLWNGCMRSIFAQHELLEIQNVYCLETGESGFEVSYGLDPRLHSAAGNTFWPMDHATRV